MNTGASSRPCTGPSAAARPKGSPQGVLEAKGIGLVAPVVEGTDPGSLEVAVGHVRKSAWPGSPGTAVLAAHDVTWFSRIDRLGPGAELDYLTPCATYRFRVTGHRIVMAGSPVYSRPSRSVLVLDTCYPTNALFVTTKRYLVYATLAGRAAAKTAIAPLRALSVPRVPAPSALRAQGLGLGANDAVLGTLQLTGDPSPAFRESPLPLRDEEAVLAEYFGLVRAARADRTDWWSALAGGASYREAAPFVSASVAAYASALDITLEVAKTRLEGATATARLEVTGGQAPGWYRVAVRFSNEGGTLRAIGFAMTP